MAQQTMKLYTEDQIKMAIDMAHNGLDGYYDITSQLTPICIPTEDELKEISKEEILYNDSKRDWWIEGGKYILNLIKSQ